MQLITEQSTKIKATLPEKDPTKKQEVFYNPLMQSNRNISVTLLNSIDIENMNMALPLAGSGIRGLRFLKELKTNKVKKLFVNDKKDNFVKNFNDNLKLNKISKSKIKICNQDAELFLLSQHKDEYCGYFDYIDIDPFGSPNSFISSGVSKIVRKGILAITATDTAALTGTYPKVTKRKYWARNVKNYLMHETGLRILIRKIQLQGIQFDKALTPILAYHKDHYFRIYFESSKGKEKCDELIKQHKYLLLNPKNLEFKTSNYNNEKGFDYMGPMWTGSLINKKLINRMVKENKFKEEQNFLELLKKESKSNEVGFYDLHALGKKYKKEAPKMEFTLNKLKGVRTHFSKYGIKTRKSLKEVLMVLK